MATTRVQAERQVMKLYNEGWHIPNIVSIAQSSAQDVKDILEHRGIDTSVIEQ